MALSVGAGLEGWTPIRVEWRGGRALVDWCHTEGVRFTEPFFHETAERCLRHPFRLLFRRETTMEELGAFVADHPGVPPAGFVFHLSRCGSTLVSQMLGAVAAHLVLSEPGPIDSILRAHHMDRSLGDEERSMWLRWMLA